MKAFARKYAIQLALIAVTMVWGGTFVVVKDAVSQYPLYAFIALRFAIAVVAFVVVIPSSVKLMRKETLRAGLLAGAFLTAAYVFQTWGLEDTSASRAAFITGMLVVITPALQAVFLRHPPARTTVAGALLAVAGLWLLSGSGGGGWNVGDTRVLLCALAYSGHMIVLGGIGRQHDVRPFTLVQLATVAVVCAAISLATEPIGLPTAASVWVAALICGVFASAVAFAVQTYAQQHLSPAKTAIILIMEPVFGAVFGYFAGDRIGLAGLAGCALMLGGMIVAEGLGPARSLGAGARTPGEVVAAVEPLEVSSLETLEPSDTHAESR